MNSAPAISSKPAFLTQIEDQNHYPALNSLIEKRKDRTSKQLLPAGSSLKG